MSERFPAGSLATEDSIISMLYLAGADRLGFTSSFDPSASELQSAAK